MRDFLFHQAKEMTSVQNCGKHCCDRTHGEGWKDGGDFKERRMYTHSRTCGCLELRGEKIEQSGNRDVPTQALGDSLTKVPYCRTFSVPGEVPGTNSPPSKGGEGLTVDIDSLLRPRTDISTILNHDVST